MLVDSVIPKDGANNGLLQSKRASNELGLVGLQLTLHSAVETFRIASQRTFSDWEGKRRSDFSRTY